MTKATTATVMIGRPDHEPLLGTNIAPAMEEDGMLSIPLRYRYSLLEN
jgi:hypothetical protein